MYAKGLLEHRNLLLSLNTYIINVDINLCYSQMNVKLFGTQGVSAVAGFSTWHRTNVKSVWDLTSMVHTLWEKLIQKSIEQKIHLKLCLQMHQQSLAISFKFECDETINIKLYCTFVMETSESWTMIAFWIDKDLPFGVLDRCKHEMRRIQR